MKSPKPQTKSRRSRPVRVVLIACVLLAGCTAGSPSTEPPPTPTIEPATYTDTITFGPRGSHEVNFFMDEGAQVRIVVNASVPMDWDLHSHKGTAVDTWDEGADVRVVDTTFTAPETNTFSVWLKSASSGTTIVRVNLTGAFELVT